MDAESITTTTRLHVRKIWIFLTTGKPIKIMTKTLIDPEFTPQRIARRLRVLRFRVCGNDVGSQSRFALLVGIKIRRWNNYEHAWPLPRDAAVRIVLHTPGLTTDWIWLGRPHGMPQMLVQELEAFGIALDEAEKAEAAKRPGRRQSGGRPPKSFSIASSS
jgi:hypothetical protein